MNDFLASLTLLDWILVALVAICLPLYGAWDFPRFLRRAEREPAAARRLEYIQTLLIEWGLVAILAILWIREGRSLRTLGLHGDTSWPFFVCAALVLLFLIFSFFNNRYLVGNEEKSAQVLEKLDSVRPLLPHSPSERQWFRAVSVTAGICEELLYRGFLLWLVTGLVGLPLAVIITSILFGFGHSYQGPLGIVRTGMVGLALALVTVFSGSLWLAIVLHIGIDWFSGELTGQILERQPADPETLASPLLPEG